jgi:glycosyltransferase involved in cell wall biosynthesis
LKPTISLQLSTYNWPKALELCLKSILTQTVMPDEVIICDDGSRTDTADVIEVFKKKFSVPFIYVWQSDEGFQLAKIRNKGFAKTEKDYIIQIDGDLILHKDFIKDHQRFALDGYFTTGSRVLLSPDTTERLFKEKSIDIKKYASKERNPLNGLHLPFLHNFLSTRYKQKGKHKYYVKGCNMAFWRKDLWKVNGYNEAFTGWGREDSELAIRLMNAGVKKRFLKFGGICYHLWHKEASREMEQINIDKMNNAIHLKLINSPKGINQYLNTKNE